MRTVSEHRLIFYAEYNTRISDILWESMIYCKFPNRTELKVFILLPFIFIYQIRLLFMAKYQLVEEWVSEHNDLHSLQHGGSSTFSFMFLSIKKVEYWLTSFQAFNDYQNNNFSLPSSLHSFRAKKEVLMTKSDVMDMWYIHQTTLRTEFHPVSFVGDTYRSTKPQSTRRT